MILRVEYINLNSRISRARRWRLIHLDGREFPGLPLFLTKKAATEYAKGHGWKVAR